MGIQGQSNVWLVFRGRCYLVTQEHCRAAVGQEILYSKPEVREALNLFKGMTSGSTYQDLTDQSGNGNDVLDHPVQDATMDSDDEMVEVQPTPSRVVEIPQELRQLCNSSGWKADAAGNPVL